MIKVLIVLWFERTEAVKKQGKVRISKPEKRERMWRGQLATLTITESQCDVSMESRYTQQLHLPPIRLRQIEKRVFSSGPVHPLVKWCIRR